LSNRKQDAALSDPASTFLEPRFVVGNKGLSHEEKVRILLDWRQDLIEQQAASEENMSRERGEPNLGARLAAVTNALIELGHQSV